MIVVIDYGAGNIRSILNMLGYLGVAARVANCPEELGSADKLILPGVGSFDYGMGELRARGFVDKLGELVHGQKMPLLGICLGAQLLTRRSDEGRLGGLGWVAADTVGFDRTRLGPRDRIPHMNWADTEALPQSRLFAGIEGVPRFYYVHSFHFRCDRSADEICHAQHGYRFVSGFEVGNVVGVQFHPEKSHRFGLQVLKNFAERY